MCFPLINSGHFSLNADFSWSNCEQYLLELITLFSRMMLPFQFHLLWMKTHLVWLVVIHLSCAMISFVSPYCAASTFHCLSQFALKEEHFPYISVKNSMLKYSQDFFFPP